MISYLRRHLAARVAALVLVLLAAFVLAFGTLAVRRQRAILRTDLEGGARVIAGNLAVLLLESVMANNFSFVNDAMQRTVDGEDILYALVAGEGNLAIAHWDPERIGEPLNGDETGRRAWAAESILIQDSAARGTPVLEVAVPVLSMTNRRFGVLRLGFSLAQVDAAVRASLVAVVLESVLLLAAAGLLALLLVRRVTRPVVRLTRDAVRIAGGELDHEVGPAGRDEVGRLAAAFEAMRAALREKIRDLQETITRLTSAEEREARLRELDALKSRFLANVSHELRTPLTLILTPLEAMRAGHYGDRLPELAPTLDTMRSNAQRLYRLIDDLLDFSRLAAGAMQVRAEELDLVGLVRDLLASVSSWLVRRELALATRFATDEARAVADREKVEKILLNLLSNAVKFSPPGGTLTVEVSAGEEVVRVAVSDSGPGIPLEEHERVFERFGRTTSAQVSGYKGTGIGLALSRELAEVQGGTLTLASEPGAGATFSLALPLVGAPAAGGVGIPDRRRESRPEVEGLDAVSLASADLALDLVPSSPPCLPPLPPLAAGGARDAEVGGEEGDATVLVVDDHPEMRELVRRILSPAFRVLTAANGAEALERMGDAPPDLVLTDVMMPVMDGYELLRRIRDTPGSSRIPVVMISAKADVGTRMEGLEHGADDYLVKPFHPQELVCRVRNLVLMGRYAHGLREWNRHLGERVRDQVAELLRSATVHRYLPRPVVDALLRGELPAVAASERRWATMLFGDLVGFTKASQELAPEQITVILNDYLGAMQREVAATGGTLGRIMGDGFMAFYGAPAEMSREEQARRAIELALGMRQALAVLNSRWEQQEGLPSGLQVRMGINAGYVTVGSFGGEGQLDYTVIGTPVNLAARLEQLAEPGAILVGHAVGVLVRDGYVLGATRRLEAKGFADPVACYPVEGRLVGTVAG
ncbi:MAG: response regulator [Candidatus Schekmanbacteria bacterium]|nr:response regulator [Candidatus Schekmanbacteria bacterium]